MGNDPTPLNSLSMFDDIRATNLEKLGLIEDPFSQAADPRYLYLGTEHLPIYYQIRGAIGGRRGLGVITGAPGTGKSSLARRFFDICNADDLIDVAYIPRTSFTTRFSAIRTICTAFPRMEVPQERGYEKQLEALRTSITEVFQQGHNVVVIFDDAQLMSRIGLEIIHELYNFEYDTKTVTSLVFGETGAIDLIRSDPSVYSRTFIHLIIPPLSSVKSVVNMVTSRLQTAGRSQPLIDDDAFMHLFHASGGIPRDIVFICSMATELIIQKNMDRITKEVMEEAINIYAQRNP